MARFRSTVLVLTIPLSLVLLAWMAIGRALFGIMTAWMAVITLVMFAPIFLLFMTVSTILMFCQPTRPRLTTAQAWLQVVIWLCMFMAGIVIVDGDDGGHVGGIALSLFGDSDSVQTACGALLMLTGFTGVATGLALVVLLIIGLTKRRHPMPQAPWPGPPPYWPPAPAWPTAATVVPPGSPANTRR